MNAGQADYQKQQEIAADVAAAAARTGVEYECGDCCEKVILKPRDAVRCQRCGYRILYKPRTKRIIQYEAR